MENTCCAEHKSPKKKGIIQGLIFGLIPHTFCIAFVLFSVIGATVAAGIVKKVLLIPYFTEILIGISILFATLAIVFYLKRQKCLCVKGIKDRWKYIATMYTVTILVNIIMFYGIIPEISNISANKIINAQAASETLVLQISIPCSGHAPLITSEIEKLDGINAITFKPQNTFEIKYDPNKLTPDQIKGIEIFKQFKVI